jgi:hypothetical protein
MYRIRQQALPFRGSSYNFVGAEDGDVNVSVFLFRGQAGAGPGPHRHPTTKSSSFRKGADRGWSMAKSAKRALATSS